MKAQWRGVGNRGGFHVFHEARDPFCCAHGAGEVRRGHFKKLRVLVSRAALAQHGPKLQEVSIQRSRATMESEHCDWGPAEGGRLWGNEVGTNRTTRCCREQLTCVRLSYTSMHCNMRESLFTVGVKKEKAQTLKGKRFQKSKMHTQFVFVHFPANPCVTSGAAGQKCFFFLLTTSSTLTIKRNLVKESRSHSKPSLLSGLGVHPSCLTA